MNRIRDWRDAAKRRHDDHDVHVHPDAGTLPSAHTHRAPVRGSRAALAQIDAELTQVEPELICSPTTARWIREEIARNDVEARDLDGRAFECMDMAKLLRHRNADLTALLAVANPVEHQPGTHTVPAETREHQAPAPVAQPAPSALSDTVVDLLAVDGADPHAATAVPPSTWWSRPPVLANGDTDDTLTELHALDGAL